ncbi:MAG: hypothetical protein MUE94_02675 [Verrucomicrobia bacterium]|jgi:hypothetical protein|nr:hypothetical protein [Verrucomicrobiota bacterium]
MSRSCLEGRMKEQLLVETRRSAAAAGRPSSTVALLRRMENVDGPALRNGRFMEKTGAPVA